jgi:hypothetical protein
MKKIKTVFAALLCFTLGAVTLVSCNDDDPAPFDAVVDVYIKDLKTDGGTKYGIEIYALGNYEIKSAKVVAPGTGGKTYELTQSSDKHQFIFRTPVNDYTNDLPVKGNYSFEITSVNDEKITGIDIVGEEKLTPISIKTATMNNHMLKVTWDKIQNAEAYAVRLYSADKTKIMFSGTLLNSNATEFEFGTSTPSWASGEQPAANTNYVVELQAVRFETGVTVNKVDNIQFVSSDSKTIKWE